MHDSSGCRASVLTRVCKPGERLLRLEDLMQLFEVGRLRLRQWAALLATEILRGVSRRRHTIVVQRPPHSKALWLNTFLSDMVNACRAGESVPALIDQKIVINPFRKMYDRFQTELKA